MVKQFEGIYYQEGKEEKRAMVCLQKNRMNIMLNDEYGKPLNIYWDYDKIIRQDFRKGDRSVVKYIGIPVQVIEVASDDFTTELVHHLDRSNRSLLKRWFGTNVSSILKLLGIIILVLSVLYFFVVPLAADRMADRVPVSFEEDMGNGMYNALSAGFKTDDPKTLLLNDFFKEMHITTSYDIKVTVVKEDIANAFALPGGHIVVYDKLLRDMDGYEQLAALLAHEFTHVGHRHATRSVFRQLGSSIFIAVLLGNRSSILNMAVSEADDLKSLSYSRKLEKEADLNGLKILSERQIDCNGFIKLFQLLQKEVNETGERVPAEWISSHPDLQNRIDYIQKDKNFNNQGVKENEILKQIFERIKSAW